MHVLLLGLSDELQANLGLTWLLVKETESIQNEVVMKEFTRALQWLASMQIPTQLPPLLCTG